MYIHDNLEFERLPSDFNSSDKNLELLTILLKPKNQTNFIVSLVYIPPTADKEISINTITALDFSTKKIHRNAVRIVAGDFNMDFKAGNKRHKDCQLLKNFEQKVGMTQLIKERTRVSKNTASLIDLIFISNAEARNVSGSVSITYNVSDHNLVWMNYKKDTISRPNVSFTFRSKTKYNRAVLMH